MIRKADEAQAASLAKGSRCTLTRSRYYALVNPAVLKGSTYRGAN
jgi:hypothetical protein